MSAGPGSRLSRYELVEEISRGGMGIVYRARDTTLNREVAVKVLPPDLVSDRDRRERFVQEAQAASALEHPNIAVIHEIGEADGVTFITMELIRGEKLSTLLSTGPLPASRALELASEVAEALARAHEKGVVHRDIKPANVMVTEQGHAKVIDFGVAKLLSPLAGDAHAETTFHDNTDVGVVLGTLAYMSPEQARGGRVDHRSDIFSLGLVLHEMLAGHPPFRGPSSAETVNSILHDAPPALPALGGTVSPDAITDIQRIRDKCLEKAADDRYQGMRDLAVDLRAARRRLESTIISPVPASRQMPRGWVWPAAAAVVAVAAAALIWVRPAREPGPSSTTKPSIAVLHFENNTGSASLDWLRTGLADMLVTDLSQSPDLEVLGTDRVYEILDELDRAGDRTISSDTVREFARRARVQTVLMGSFVKSGDAIRINVRLQDALDGRILSAERMDAQGEANLFPTIDQLTQRIKARLEPLLGGNRASGLFVRPSPPAAPDSLDRGLRDVTTSSIEAYRYYAEGIHLHGRARYTESIPLFQKALEIDPQFALAMAKLAVDYGNSGRMAQSREWAERAYQHANRVTTRERYYIEGYHYSRRAITLAKAIEAYETGLKLYPDHAAMRNNLALIYIQLDRREDALPHLEELVRRGHSYAPTFANLAGIHTSRGDFERAHQVLTDYVQRYPDVAAGHVSLGTLYTVWRKYDEALAAFARAQGLEPGRAGAFRGRYEIHVLREQWDQADALAESASKSSEQQMRNQGHINSAHLHLYRGRSAAALALLEQGARASDNPRFAAQEVSAVMLARGDLAAARRFAESSEDANANPEVGPGRLRSLGWAQELTGQPAQADRTLEELRGVARRVPSDRDMRHAHLLAGQIAMHRGHPMRAIEELLRAEKAIPMRQLGGPPGAGGLAIRVRFELASAYLAVGQLAEAEARLRAVVDGGRERISTPIEYVRSLYVLGTIYEKLGDTARARDHYRYFLDHWRGGDLDRDKVREAERTLQSLPLKR